MRRQPSLAARRVRDDAVRMRDDIHALGSIHALRTCPSAPRGGTDWQGRSARPPTAAPPPISAARRCPHSPEWWDPGQARGRVRQSARSIAAPASLIFAVAASRVALSGAGARRRFSALWPAARSAILYLQGRAAGELRSGLCRCRMGRRIYPAVPFGGRERMHLDERAFDDGVGHGNPGEGRKQSHTDLLDVLDASHQNNWPALLPMPLAFGLRQRRRSEPRPSTSSSSRTNSSAARSTPPPGRSRLTASALESASAHGRAGERARRAVRRGRRRGPRPPGGRRLPRAARARRLDAAGPSRRRSPTARGRSTPRRATRDGAWAQNFTSGRVNLHEAVLTPNASRRAGMQYGKVEVRASCRAASLAVVDAARRPPLRRVGGGEIDIVEAAFRPRRAGHRAAPHDPLRRLRRGGRDAEAAQDHTRVAPPGRPLAGLSRLCCETSMVARHARCRAPATSSPSRQRRTPTSAARATRTSAAGRTRPSTTETARSTRRRRTLGDGDPQAACLTQLVSEVAIAAAAEKGVSPFARICRPVVASSRAGRTQDRSPRGHSWPAPEHAEGRRVPDRWRCARRR